MNSDDSAGLVERGFAKIGLDAALRHVFLCIGPNCCSNEAGEAVWEHLKQALSRSSLPAMRTKAACLRICSGGPWLVVYPEGVWYGAMTVERCERIVTDHLIGGRVVQEWAARVHPLPSAGLDKGGISHRGP